MTRGTQFLNNSKCPCCKKQDRVNRPYGHMSESRNLYLKGYCPLCHKTKSLPYTKEQLNMEGEGIKKFFKNVYNKVLKPIGKETIKNISKDPMKALKLGTQLGSAIASKNPSAIMNAGMQAGKFGVLGQGVPKGGAIKIADMNNSAAGLYIYRPK